MSNDVQSHDTVVERAAADRRTSGRHAAAKLGTVQARLIGGSPVDLVNFSNRGVLFECDSRLLIGARASVRITSPEHHLVVTGRVVRSRVKGLVNGALRYDAALALDHEFALTPALAELMARLGAVADEDFDVTPDREPVDEYLAESEASLAEAVRDREATGPVDETPAEETPAVAQAIAQTSVAETSVAETSVAESVVAEDEPVAFEADGEIAFEPAIEFTVEPAVEFAVEGGDEVAFEPEVAAPPADTVSPLESAAAAEAAAFFDATPPAPAEPAAVPFFDATRQVQVNPGVSMFDATPAAADAGADASEPSPAAEADVAFEAVAFAAADAVDFEAAVGPADVAPIDAAPEPSSAVTPAPADVEDRVMQQFAATVPDDLADLRRIAADNQW